jgi:cytoskeletal protein CcmA (bactofilin family)
MEENKGQDTSQDENALEKPPEQMNALESLSDTDDAVHAAPGEEPKKPAKKPEDRKGFKKILSFFNVYLLIFLLLVVVAGIIFVVSYINSQKEPEQPSTALQDLTQEQLAEIANGDASVGDPRYVLNIQSDAVFAGNALIRGDLNVAGSLQLGQGLTIPSLTVSGPSNLAATQVNTLQVASTSVFQGAVTMQADLTARGANFGGTISAPTINTANLTIAGNGSLTLNNHIRANGPTPGRTQGNAVGAGGSTSISGSDLAGTLNVNTGGGTAPGCFATINFVQRFDGTPHVLVTPVGAAGGQTQFYVQRSPTNFSICTANAAPTGQSFAFDYFVIN